MEVTPGDAIALAALGFSIFSIWRQRRYDELGKRLNEILIEKEQSETVDAKRGDLSAGFVKSGQHSYQFRIYNRGKGAARNIRLTPLEGEALLHADDLARKFPYPSLDTHQPLNVLARVHMQSPRRVSVRLEWDDDAGGGTKDITADVF